MSACEMGSSGLGCGMRNVLCMHPAGKARKLLQVISWMMIASLIGQLLMIDTTRNHVITLRVHSKNTRASRDPEKGPLGPKLHSGSTVTRKSVKLTNNGVRLTQFWVIFRVKLTSNCIPNLGHLSACNQWRESSLLVIRKVSAFPHYRC